MSPKRQRLAFVLLSVVCISAAVLLVMQALKSKVVFFYSPSDLVEMKPATDTPIRIGGLVEKGSLKHQKDNQIAFTITDGDATIAVAYRGLLPNLFREGQGVVAEGALQTDGSFNATSILAKHDENYMPPEVADALKKSGRWRDGEPIKEPEE